MVQESVSLQTGHLLRGWLRLINKWASLEIICSLSWEGTLATCTQLCPNKYPYRKTGSERAAKFLDLKSMTVLDFVVCPRPFIHSLFFQATHIEEHSTRRKSMWLENPLGGSRT
jgi:hypothetical protein